MNVTHLCIVIFKSLKIWKFSPSTYVLWIFFASTCNLLAKLTLMKLCLLLGFIETIAFSCWIHPRTCNRKLSYETKLPMLFLSFFTTRDHMPKNTLHILNLDFWIFSTSQMIYAILVLHFLDEYTYSLFNSLEILTSSILYILQY